MIPWTALFAATAWVDFAVIVLSKVFPLTKSLSTWYADFGLNAVGMDVLVIVLGIALAKLLFPAATGLALIGTAVAIQIVHDLLFYIIILVVPPGQNRVMDLFKRYAAEGSWKIILADSAMVAASVYGMEMLDAVLTDDQVLWTGLLGLYSLLYILYTK
jgi:hypothetical protein